MAKIFDYSLIYLIILVINIRSKQGGIIPYSEFESKTLNDKKLALKAAFEKDLYSMYDLLKKQIEQVQDKELSINQRKDLERYKLALTVAGAVKASIDKELHKNCGLPTNFCCAFHDDSTPSMNYFFAKKAFYCFGCCQDGHVYDLFNLLDIISQVQTGKAIPFKEQFQKAVDLYVIDNGKKSSMGMVDSSNHIPYTQAMNKVRHGYLNLCDIKNDNIGKDYLKVRGISVPTARRLSVMTFAPKSDTSGADMGRVYLTFINGDGSYVRRLIYEDKEISELYSIPAYKWWNSKGEIGVFNEQVLNHCKENGEVCFVCEGALDALSCEELGFHAVAINSVNHSMKFLDKYKGTGVKFVCLADNDDGGQAMFKAFESAGIFIPPYVNGEGGYTLTQHKDCNECLIEDKEGLRKDLEKLCKGAELYYSNL